VSSIFSGAIKLSLFGQSHGEAIGMTLDGFPAGVTLDMAHIRQMLLRRAPGRGEFTSSRQEDDVPEILSGVWKGVTTGQPLTVIFRNQDARPEDYPDMDVPRPGHADYTGHVHYFGHEDYRGGGHFSGRLTAPVVFAGALCGQYLKSRGVTITAHILRLGDVQDDSFLPLLTMENADRLAEMSLPVLRADLVPKMEETIRKAREQGDSVGGTIECRVDGLPAGLGAPFFDSVESVLSHLMFSIPAVKGVSFGEGFGFARLAGSQANDALRMQGDNITFQTNHSGGVQGGITNGMPVVFQCAVRATPSIAMEQQSVSLSRKENAPVAVQGRHDPCILPRALPVVEAMAAIGVMSLWQERAGQEGMQTGEKA